MFLVLVTLTSSKMLKNNHRSLSFDLRVGTNLFETYHTHSKSSKHLKSR